jgi:hypothetical protein
MSLASTASSWTNDNIQTRKRIPSIRRTAKLRPYDDQTNLQPYEYISSESKHKNLKIDTIEETEKQNLSSSMRVNDVLNKITSITSENDGNRLADYKPLDNTYLNTRKTTVEDVNKFEREFDENDETNKNTLFDDLLPKTLESQPYLYSASNINEHQFSNYGNTYESPKLFQGGSQSYYSKPINRNGNSNNHYQMAGTTDNKLMEKINYMIHLLEEQQSEKTANVMEEFILYVFLGVFVIFTVDSFSRSGKYTR